MGRFAAVVACVAILPADARAECAAVTLLSCDMPNGKQLEVCVTPATGPGTGAFTYSFGPPGRPELQLSVPMSAGTVTPWPGVGRSIWSAVSFANDGYVYEAWHAFDRIAENPQMSGGVSVLRDGQTVASLECLPGGTIAPAFTLEDEMADAGLCWNFEGQVW